MQDGRDELLAEAPRGVGAVARARLLAVPCWLTRIPLARPVLGERGGAGCRSRCCAPGSFRWGRAWRSSSGLRRARRGAAYASAVSSGTAGLAPGAAGGGGAAGDEVVTSPLLVRRLGERRALRAGAAGLRRHRPGHAQPRPAGGGGGGHRAHAGAAAGAHLRLSRRHGRVRADRAAARAGRSWRTPARRSAPSTPTARPWAGAGIRRCSASTPTSSSRRARAGWSRLATALLKERIDSERNQGRAPDMGWLDHDRLGFNYRLSDIACALGLAQLERLEEMLAARARVAGLLSGGARRDRGARAAL